MVISQIKNVNNNSLICYRIPPYSAGFWWEIQWGANKEFFAKKKIFAKKILRKEKDAKKAKKNIADKFPILHLF